MRTTRLLGTRLMGSGRVPSFAVWPNGHVRGICGGDLDHRRGA